MNKDPVVVCFIVSPQGILALLPCTMGVGIVGISGIVLPFYLGYEACSIIVLNLAGVCYRLHDFWMTV